MSEDRELVPWREEKEEKKAEWKKMFIRRRKMTKSQWQNRKTSISSSSLSHLSFQLTYSVSSFQSWHTASAALQLCNLLCVFSDLSRLFCLSTQGDRCHTHNFTNWNKEFICIHTPSHKLIYTYIHTGDTFARVQMKKKWSGRETPNHSRASRSQCW